MSKVQTPCRSSLPSAQPMTKVQTPCQTVATQPATSPQTFRFLLEFLVSQKLTQPLKHKQPKNGAEFSSLHNLSALALIKISSKRIRDNLEVPALPSDPWQASRPPQMARLRSFSLLRPSQLSHRRRSGRARQVNTPTYLSY
ncbi:unnamed protein product, partial [Prunus brigantina]